MNDNEKTCGNCPYYVPDCDGTGICKLAERVFVKPNDTCLYEGRQG